MRSIAGFAACLFLSGCFSASAETEPPPPERRLIVPPVLGSWRSEHCGMVSAIPRGDGFRIFATGKPFRSQTWSIGWIDVDKNFRELAASPAPILEPDPKGHDSRGVLMPTVIECGSELRMYYVGVGQPRYDLDLNHRPMLAISHDRGDTWQRVPGPLLELTEGEESIGTSYAWHDVEGWRLIYTSVLGRPPDRRYVFRFAQSPDGITWHKPPNNLALDIPDRTCGRPFVWKEAGKYLLTYSFSGGGIKYRIRCAASDDGFRFHDLGQILDVAPAGFDSEMVEYAWILPDRRTMLYSGNQWGSTGIGLAKFELPH